MRQKVLIKGAGEQASGTAHRLVTCGYRVVMTDLAAPTAVRRTVSFCTAVDEGEVVVEGLRAVRCTLDRVDMLARFDWSHIPVFVDPGCELRSHWKPEVIIDGRILKQNLDNSPSDAPLVIGYGPGLVAGRDVHAVVETNRGHDLGRIITEGAAAEDTHVPSAIGGVTLDRVLRAPVSGTFTSKHKIGDLVEVGSHVGRVGQRDVIAGTSGVLRGLLRDASQVATGQKLGDIDPRGDTTAVYTISDKARTISGSALEIIVRQFNGGQ